MSRDVPVVVVIRSEYILCPMMYHSECSGEEEVSFCHFLRELLSPKIDAEKLKRRRKCHLGHSLAKHAVFSSDRSSCSDNVLLLVRGDGGKFVRF